MSESDPGSGRAVFGIRTKPNSGGMTNGHEFRMAYEGSDGFDQ